MKNHGVFIGLFLTFLMFNANSQIKVISNGKVGINQAYPVHNLDLYGTARFWTTWGSFIFDSSGNSNRAILYPSTSAVGDLGKESNKFFQIWCHDLHYDNTYDWSDERLKENIKPLKNSLSRIKSLNAVTFNMKDEFYDTKDSTLLLSFKKDRKLDMGFIAQEVLDVFPEIVKLDSASNLYLLNYVKLIPVLVEAIQELEARVETIENTCCNQNENLKSAIVGKKGINSIETKLYQNAPNPFNIQTAIHFEIPESIQKAQLIICNMTGAILKTIDISKRGNNSVTINANEFDPGMYLYSLIVDDKVCGTKQMLLTE